MAELTFVGAAGTVTGSKHLITSNGKHFFIDCGLFQGQADVTALNNVALPVAPSDVSAVVITHGHIDHVGYLPKFVKDGFRGPIFCTPPTKALMEIVLEDASNLQQHLQARGFHHGPQAPPPFYGSDDVAQTLKQVQTFDLRQQFDVSGIAQATYFNAAHILGSAFVKLQLEGKTHLFSGDIGRYGRPLLYDPEAIGATDTIVCESTYGGQMHPPQPLDQLRDALLAGVAAGGAMVIPAFAVERSQDILLAIATLQQQVPQLANLPVYLDSPMADKVDQLFIDFPNAHKQIPLSTEQAPFGCKDLTVARTTDESKAINHVQGPHAIISSSGMAAGGRVLHHIHNHLGDPKASIIFVGYQGAGTLGFTLIHGAKTVRILGDQIPVRAKTIDLQGYSAHADQGDFNTWFSTCTSKPKLYAIHGEPQSAEALCTFAEQNFGWDASVGQRGATVTL